MYSVNLLKSSGHITSLVSKQKAGIVALRQYYLHWDEQLYMKMVLYKYFHKASRVCYVSYKISIRNRPWSTNIP